MDSLVPQLRRIEVSPDKLILDPNNPRLITRGEDKIDEAHFGDPGVVTQTHARMVGDADAFRIAGLEESILTNGWQPIDFIFVRKYGDAGHYLVLEGNRRVAAIRRLLDPDRSIAEPLRESLDPLEVMEITDDISKEELDVKICYLLGVRHHGSLEKWSPFARAHNMYRRYLALSGRDDAGFEWDEGTGNEIASALSITTKVVRDRLKVYRAMSQIGRMPAVAAVNGMKARYYSVCDEVLLKKSRRLKDYIRQDPLTFELDDVSLDRFDNLCHFSTEGRKGAPIHNPQEWRKLDRILDDDEKQRREQMLREVEVEKRRPSDVWAVRWAEIHTLQWHTWLRQINLILSDLKVGDVPESNEARDVIQQLIKLLEELDERDLERGASDAQAEADSG